MTSRGFSLLEAIFTMFLLGIIFLVAGDLARSFVTYRRKDSDVTRKVMACREALTFLSKQARTAVSVAADGPTLTLESIIDPQNRFPALPLPLGAVAPAGWEPDTPRLSTVYSHVGQSLEATSSLGTKVLVPVVSGFSAERQDRILTLSLSWTQGIRVAKAQSKVFLSL